MSALRKAYPNFALRRGTVITANRAQEDAHVRTWRYMQKFRGERAVFDAAIVAHGGDVNVIDLLEHSPRRRVQRILKEIADLYRVTIMDITGCSRAHIHKWPRFVAIWRIRKELGWSLQRIGREFSNRDHTTILNALRKTDARIFAGDAPLGISFPQAAE